MYSTIQHLRENVSRTNNFQQILVCSALTQHVIESFVRSVIPNWNSTGVINVFILDPLRSVHMVRQRLRQWQHFSVITIGFRSMDLFTLCSSSSGCGNSNTSKQVPTLFCAAVAAAKWQQQNILQYIACQFATAAAAQCEHFGSIAAEKPLPLPHRMNGPLL